MHQRELPVGVIGAGVSGLAMGLRLQRAGLPFVILEKAEEVGGTWRDNRYPGLTIDVPSPIYTYTSQRHAGWRRWMPDGPEILDYHREVSFRTGLRDDIRFGSEVVEATWADDRWEVRTRDGDRHTFRALVCATGFLHHPNVPDIPGLESFAGRCVHSARWDDAIETAGRRIGVVGCGSSGIQIVSALGGAASHVTHFQRTPQWIFPLPNFDVPRAVRAVFARWPRTMDAAVEGIEWLADRFLGGAATAPGWRRRLLDGLARRHLATVRDPALRSRLTPPDEPLCKRPIVSTSYYRVVQRPDVSVETSGIERVVPEGIVTADGRVHELDVLILATGFRAHDYMRPMAITGEAGMTLGDAWANGPYGYRTMTIPGFPNLFMLLGPHSPLVSIAIHHSAELQADYAGQMLERMDRDGLVSVAPTAAATSRWMDYVRQGMPGTIWSSGCSSWYLGGGDVPVLWPYDRRRWRELLATPDLADYEVRAVAAPEPAALR